MGERITQVENKMREASIFAHSKLKSHTETCMYAGSCNRRGIRAHAIQRLGPLKLLEEGGKVVAPDQVVGKSVSEGPGMKVSKVGWKNAMIFRGLCEPHDGEVFKPIDMPAGGQLNYSDFEQTFLLGYRGCLKAVYELRRRIKWQRFGAEKAEVLGLVAKGSPNPFRIQEQHFRSTAKPAEEFRQNLDTAYLNSNYSRLKHEMIEIPGPGKCAAASGAFYDRDDGNGNPAFMTVNLIPETNQHILLLSFLPAQRDAHQPYIDLLRSKFGKSLRELVSRLILLRVRSFVLRESLWDSFSSQQKQKITNSLMTQSYPGDLAGQTDPHLNLFEPLI